jgi:hypothetical protein
LPGIVAVITCSFDDVKKRKFKKELLKVENKIAATMILINLYFNTFL